MSFKNKVVIVTGSSSGIGASTAIKFAKEGAHVVIVGRDEAKLNNVKGECEKFGRIPLVIRADISRDSDARRIVDRTVAAHGTIDILVNNAGSTERVDITRENFMDTFDRIINVNLRGVVFISHVAIPHLIKSKGNIINVSSVAGSRTIGLPNTIPYCVSKAGLDHFTRCAALKLSEYGVRVNAVSPGPVRTDILRHSAFESITFERLAEGTVLNRISDPEEIADLILFLASDKAKGITGSNFVSDNGYLIKN